MIRPFLIGLGKMTMAGDSPAPQQGEWRSYILAKQSDSYLVVDDKERDPVYGVALPSAIIEPGTVPSAAAVKLAIHHGLRVAGTKLLTVWIDADDSGKCVKNFIYEIRISTAPHKKDYPPTLNKCFYWNPSEDLGSLNQGSRHAFEMMDMQKMTAHGEKAIVDTRSLDLFYK